QRLARFEREAQLLASLNHPNIAAIHSFEHADGIHFLVLELVEGETLAERIAKGPLPAEEALEVCRQIAEGVEAAHEKGVIHRDLKPANVKVTPEGMVKVLDFGLAKALEGETPVADISHSPTLTDAMTRVGVILGTAGYMSPEQAKGKSVDKRADVWALGCVLYELLTGKRAFHGETITETVAKVLESEPDWEALPENTPGNIRTLLHRCLHKDSNDRFRDIGDARIEIKHALSKPKTASPIGVISPVRPAGWKLAIPWVLAVTTVALLISLVGLWRATRPAEQTPVRLHVQLPPDQSIDTRGGAAAILSPDGKRLAYVARSGGTTQLYVRALDQLEGTVLSGTEGAQVPFFSPDGQWVGFTAGGKLKKVSVSGGAVVTLCAATNTNGASWGPDDTIIFTPSTNTGLFRVPAAGGTPEEITVPDPEKGEPSHRYPQILPGGKWVLFSAGVTGSFDDANIVVRSLETGERKVVHRGGYYPHYVPTGHLVFMHEATLFAVPFDLDRLELTGAPAPILEGVLPDPTFGEAQFAFSQTGTLIYLPGGEGGGGLRSLVWVDREGHEEPLAAEPRRYWAPRVSPDGSRLAIDVAAGNTDVWIYDLAHETPTRLTFDAAIDGVPLWTPDGLRVVFQSGRDGGAFNLFWKAADGTGPVERLTTSPNPQIAYSFSRDGKSLVFTE
ncbi:protein kinase, partial [Acidobacteria bacterium AH-259-A15]|nr:protein kinase [Acidobacteria bacterium AH-259-A15]